MDNDEKTEWTPAAGSPFSMVLESVEGQVRVTRAKKAIVADIHWNEPETEGNNKTSSVITPASTSSCLPLHDDEKIKDPDHSPNANPSVQSAKSRSSRSSPQTLSLDEDKELPEIQGKRQRRNRRKKTSMAPPPAGLNNELCSNSKNGSDNMTVELPKGSSSSAQLNDALTRHQSDKKSRDLSDPNLSCVGTRVKRLKRKAPGHFESHSKLSKHQEELEQEESVGTTSSNNVQENIDQTQPNIFLAQWLLDMDGVFEEIKDYEMFFSRDDSGKNLEDALKLLRDAEFHQRQAKTKFSKVISEGKARIPELRDSPHAQAIETFKDLKNKVKDLTSMAQRQISSLSISYNFRELMVEISDLEGFTEKNLIDLNRRQEEEEATTTNEYQQQHRLLEKEVQWRQGRIEDIKRRVKPAVLEIDDLKNRLKNVEIAWKSLARMVRNESKFFQFEKTCEESCALFKAGSIIADNEEYGNDVEQTIVLLKDFEALMTNAAEKCDELDDLAQDLIDEGYPNVEKLRQKTSHVKELSDKFQEIAVVQLSVLKRVKQVHIFSKQADETLKFIEDKKKFVLDSANDYHVGVDLQSLPSQIDRHEKEEESFNKLVKDEIKRLILTMEVETMGDLFPEEKELLQSRHEECVKLWRQMQDLLVDRGKSLFQARDLQKFFDKHVKVLNQISCWITEVNGIQLCRNVDDARTSLATCQNYEKVIKEFWYVEDLRNEGARLLEIDSVQLFRKELTDKMETLREKWGLLKTTCEDMLDDLQENLDAELKYEKLKERKRNRLTNLDVESESVDKDF